MTTDREFDALLRSWFDEAAGSASSDQVLASVLTKTARIRPRPAWLARLVGEPMADDGHAGVHRIVPVALAATALIVAVLVGLSIITRSPNVGPPPSSASATPRVTAAAAGVWIPTDSMIHAREGHTATLLQDGTVLVAGGPTDAAEIYDPAARSWTVTGSMTQARSGHTATLLADGRVLVVGCADAELYDPGTGSWTATGAMQYVHERGHTATLLPDGTVLVAGGTGAYARRATAEVFDPDANVWTATAEMTRAHGYHTAVLLPDGMVLVAGSLYSGAYAELYDPSTRSWTATGRMNHGRHDFTATMLADGRVLVAAFEGSPTAELYDPQTGTWTETDSMSANWLGSYTATLLPDGTVLLVGGAVNAHARAELYDPATETWSAAADLSHGRQYHAATLLPDGTVLVTGGRGRTDSPRSMCRQRIDADTMRGRLPLPITSSAPVDEPMEPDGLSPVIDP